MFSVKTLNQVKRQIGNLSDLRHWLASAFLTNCKYSSDVPNRQTDGQTNSNAESGLLVDEVYTTKISRLSSLGDCVVSAIDVDQVVSCWVARDDCSDTSLDDAAAAVKTPSPMEHCR